MRRWRRIAVAFFGSLLTTCVHSPPAPRGPTIIPLTIHDLTGEGQETKLQADIARGNRALSPYGILLVLWEHKHRAPPSFVSKPVVANGRDLWITREVVDDGTLHVFLVDIAKLEGKDVNGFTHRSANTYYIVLDSDSTASTLAHEVGHVLGLEHSEDTNNIMCACREQETAIFDPEQGDAMRRRVREFLASTW